MGFLFFGHHLLCHSLVRFRSLMSKALKSATQRKLNAYSKAGCKNKAYYSIKKKE